MNLQLDFFIINKYLFNLNFDKFILLYTKIFLKELAFAFNKFYC